MTYEFATWMLPALRADPLVAPRVVEVAGWQTRGRPPAQFSFAPSGIIEHHTACFAKDGHDPQTCLNGILNGHSGVPGPISQLLISWTPLGTKWNGRNVDPRVILVAAGRANHAGTGTYRWGAPSGNGSSLGIECCGPVQGWPDQIIEFRERVTAALLRHRGWTADRVMTHWEYGTPRGRKIDPSGGYIWEPKLTVNQPWNPDAWRLRLIYRLMNPPTPPTPPTPPDPPPPPPKPEPPVPENLTDTAATMWKHPDWQNIWLIGAGAAINVSPKVAVSLTARGVPTIVEAHAQLLKGCLAQSALTTADLVPERKP